MRTNIDIDDHLLARARELLGAKTKKETVEQALVTAIRLAEQGRVRDLRGRLAWDGDLEQLRT